VKSISQNSYFQILRINHWFKNLFLIFGIVTGLWYTQSSLFQFDVLVKTLMAFLIASILSSSNYIINQIADADFDKKHDSKKDRPIPSGRISILRAKFLAILLMFSCIVFSYTLFSVSFSITLLLFGLAGFVYNIRPVRLKDIPYIDVLAESINNPIRFLLGWYIVFPLQFPPVVILLLTWSVGALLMTAKRYDELMFYGNKLVLYRATFKSYSLASLKFMLILYSILTLILTSIVIWYYQRSLLITIPIIATYSYWLVKEIISGRAKTKSVESFVLSKKFILFTLLVALVMILLA
jgi:decaprenyl-phosphate phosphoribosyltransferase